MSADRERSGVGRIGEGANGDKIVPRGDGQNAAGEGTCATEVLESGTDLGPVPRRTLE